jgi:N-methylhydantoinase A/oxoprolinase/acetone carboxylase beta subunit
MILGIGIDTGGTYTDAVLYNFEQKKVLNSSKALTTKDDLSKGILNALDGLPPEHLKDAELISISTTLATNACVENKGGRAKLIFIGADREVVRDVGETYGLPGVSEIYFLESDCDFKGKVISEPDWDAFSIEIKDWLKDAQATGVVQLFAMRSNAVFENRAKEIIEESCGLPVICGNELFSDLNAVRRGSSILLNARLIPIIGEFLDAIKTALLARNISASVVIVRSDGGLMSENLTFARPVETLICGPAAGVIGAMELTGENDCIIIDMGGTTTDSAIVKSGKPVSSEFGVTVGGWRTFVKGVSVDTIGLGGDSAVRINRHREMSLESDRVIPISVAAETWPDVVPKLKEISLLKPKHTQPLHEFFVLVKDVSEDPKYNVRERTFCRALKDGPLCYSQAAAAYDADVYFFNLERLEKEGIVIRCGLTPTDVMQIKGDFKKYDTEAALLAIRFVARGTGKTEEELIDAIYDAVKKKMYVNTVRLLLEDRYPEFRKTGLGDNLKKIIADSWESAKNGEEFAGFDFKTTATIVGIGAPTHIFIPDVAAALGTKYVIPPNAGVANALGAIVGNVSAYCDIEIQLENYAGVEGFMVYGKQQNRFFDSLEEATQIALEEAKRAAENEAILRGAVGDISIVTEISTRTAESTNFVEVFLGSTVTATAVGRAMA